MNSFHISSNLKERINSNNAFHYRIVPIREENGVIVLKTDNENHASLRKELNVVLDFETTLEQDTQENIQSYLTLNYRQKTNASSEISQNDFLKQLLQTAKDFNSSDIHLEPYEDICRVRFRLDGKLKEYYTIPLDEYPRIINIIKNEAGLDIAQNRLPQDGRITFEGAVDSFDIRVSTMLTMYGEKIVLRILKRNAEAVELRQLGFNDIELKRYLEGIKSPNGIILISGPTGSGKTTTLYGTLKLLNKEETNVLTIEDPIEYTLKGINQVQLKEDIGFDFPTALRTFLRQDPDVIMVGEIRDDKTANMAIKASLTGHLVLSTVHTNSAWATISRLIDMGVPPYLIANTLKLSLAQRLVRKLCDTCKKKKATTNELFPENFSEREKIISHHVPVGCNECFHTGYKGRKALYEIIPVTSKLEMYIKQNKLQIDDYLSENNIDTLKDNAIKMICSGETSIDEVYSLLTN